MKIGMEAGIALDILQDNWVAAGMLQEPEPGYLIDQIDALDARELLEVLRCIRERMSVLGIQESMAGETLAGAERLLVTREYRIFLPDRYGVEMRLPPLLKTLFLLFLKHPEGIRFNRLRDYRKELMDIYSLTARQGDRPSQEQVIDRLIDTRCNSIHENAAKLPSALSRYLDSTILEQYLITGPAGTPKRIPLDRRYVEWE